MAALARLAIASVRNGKIETARATVDFLEKVLRSPRLHPEIRNAVAISFVDPAKLRTFETRFWSISTSELAGATDLNGGLDWVMVGGLVGFERSFGTMAP